jgi:peptide deformylase
MKILTYPDPLLEMRCSHVNEKDLDELSKIDTIANEMVELMLYHNGVGLAANQVGILKRFIVYIDIGVKTLINPCIVEQKGFFISKESCLSLPGMIFPVLRNEAVVVKGYDLCGNEVKINAERQLSIILQHEIDHLNGGLINYSSV